MDQQQFITLIAAVLYAGDGGPVHQGGFEAAVEAARELYQEVGRQLAPPTDPFQQDPAEGAGA